jgi:hypothetical protein
MINDLSVKIADADISGNLSMRLEDNVTPRITASLTARNFDVTEFAENTTNKQHQAGNSSKNQGQNPAVDLNQPVIFPDVDGAITLRLENAKLNAIQLENSVINLKKEGQQIILEDTRLQSETLGGLLVSLQMFGGEKPRVTGGFELDVTKLSTLVGQFPGQDIASLAPAFNNRLQVKTEFAGTPRRIQLKGISGTLGETQMSGDITLIQQNPYPKIDGDIVIKNANFDAFMPKTQQKQPPSQAQPSSNAQAQSATFPPIDSNILLTFENAKAQGQSIKTARARILKNGNTVRLANAAIDWTNVLNAKINMDIAQKETLHFQM